MPNKEESRKITLDHMIDEKFGEIFFLAKDEFDIGSSTAAEQELYDRLEQFKADIKQYCKEHHGERA